MTARKRRDNETLETYHNHLKFEQNLEDYRLSTAYAQSLERVEELDVLRNKGKEKS